MNHIFNHIIKGRLFNLKFYVHERVELNILIQ